MRWLKIGAVIFCAVTITSLGIDAADTLSGKSGTMLGQLVSSESGICPKGMTEVRGAMSFTCIDTYEASAHKDCTSLSPQSQIDTQENLNDADCSADSREGVEPWRFITREQAQTACMRAGKRLPDSGEWYTASIGTIDVPENCNISSKVVMQTGTHPECASASKVIDMIGNVWEWTSDDIIDGRYNGRVLPEEGYVAQVDARGVATVTDTKYSDLFYQDYFWSSKEGAYGVLRGGFYGSEEDAGIYAFHGKTLPTAEGNAIGFRCVQ